MGCFTPDCSRPPVGNEAFCRDCWRLIPDELRQGLRLVDRSPMYAVTAWPRIDGAEVMVITDGDAVWYQRGVQKITDVLRWLEARMVLLEIGKAIRRKQAAKERLARRSHSRALDRWRR